jgi:hypothetical protein
MTKVIYLAVVLLLLSPTVLAAVLTIYSARQFHRIQEDAQRGTSDTVYVRGHSTLTLGRVRIPIYLHIWAAVSVLVGVSIWFVSTVFLFFVRQS